MVTHPRLFIQTLRAQAEQRADRHLRDGPEGQCAATVRQLLALLGRLHPSLAALDPAAPPRLAARADPSAPRPVDPALRPCQEP